MGSITQHHSVGITVWNMPTPLMFLITLLLLVLLCSKLTHYSEQNRHFV